MNKKLMMLATASVVLILLQNAALADFDAGQFAHNFGTQHFTVRGPGPPQQVIYVDSGNFSSSIGAYDSRVAGMVDPDHPWWFIGPEIDGFYVIGGSGYSSVKEGTIFFDDIYFSSFALNPVTAQNYQYFGKLDYSNGATRTSDGNAINLGIVYLYTEYATYGLHGYDYDNHSTAAALNEAFQLLLSGSITTAQWQNNPFLRHLVTESGDSSVWLTQYNLNETYPNWVDNNYAVYVMNLSQIDYDRLPELYPLIPTLPTGDVLYLVSRNSGVPEPATFISWAVIGLGLFGTARHRKRRNADTKR